MEQLGEGKKESQKEGPGRKGSGVLLFNLGSGSPPPEKRSLSQRKASKTKLRARATKKKTPYQLGILIGDYLRRESRGYPSRTAPLSEGSNQQTDAPTKTKPDANPVITLPHRRGGLKRPNPCEGGSNSLHANDRGKKVRANRGKKNGPSNGTPCSNAIFNSQRRG